MSLPLLCNFLDFSILSKNHLNADLTASYSSSGLTHSSGITIEQGGVAEIGNLVVINLRLNVNNTGENTISGFPMPLLHANNMVTFSTSKPKDTLTSFLQTINYPTPTLVLQVNSTGACFVSATYIKG